MRERKDFSHQQPMLLIFQPLRSCTSFGYIVASPVGLDWPQKNIAPSTLKNKYSDGLCKARKEATYYTEQPQDTLQIIPKEQKI